MKTTPKVTATLKFLKSMLLSGWPPRAAMLATDGFIARLRFSQRDRKALADQVFVIQLANALSGHGLFKGRH